MSPLVQLILGQIPGIVQMVKEAHRQADPTAPAITSEQVITAFNELVGNTLAKDEMLRVALQAEIDAQG